MSRLRWVRGAKDTTAKTGSEPVQSCRTWSGLFFPLVSASEGEMERVRFASGGGGGGIFLDQETLKLTRCGCVPQVSLGRISHQSSPTVLPTCDKCFCAMQIQVDAYLRVLLYFISLPHLILKFLLTFWYELRGALNMYFRDEKLQG
jgi:hypothetical protein